MMEFEQYPNDQVKARPVLSSISLRKRILNSPWSKVRLGDSNVLLQIRWCVHSAKGVLFLQFCYFHQSVPLFFKIQCYFVG